MKAKSKNCKECYELSGLRILIDLMKETFGKDEKTIIQTYHNKSHKLF